MYDVAVLGATPAGYSAAWYASKQGLSTALMDAPSQSIESPLSLWAPRDFFRIKGLPRGLMKRCGAREFRRVCYHDAALERVVEYRSRGAAGYFIRSGDLCRALRAEARRAGVKIRASRTSPAIQLEEDHVELVGSSRLRARLLLVAHSHPAEIIASLSLPMRNVPCSPMIVAGIDAPLAGKTVPAALGGAMHVVELSDRNELGMFFVANSVLHARVISKSHASGNRAAELSAMLGALQRVEILPSDLRLQRARGAVWHPPSGVALELETHVAKRCLLAGTAGGFADSITGHTLTPSVRSALLAADVALGAADSDEAQDVLMRFKNSWRKSLANYLCPPNTSLQMLLPLLFANRRIVSKFTRALLYGENI